MTRSNSTTYIESDTCAGDRGGGKVAERSVKYIKDLLLLNLFRQLILGNQICSQAISMNPPQQLHYSFNSQSFEGCKDYSNNTARTHTQSPHKPCLLPLNVRVSCSGPVQHTCQVHEVTPQAKQRSGHSASLCVPRLWQFANNLDRRRILSAIVVHVLTLARNLQICWSTQNTSQKPLLKLQTGE